MLFVEDSGELFGWGNSEYDQLSVVTGDQIQLSVPRRLPFESIVGKVKGAAAAGSMCAVVNGNCLYCSLILFVIQWQMWLPILF